MIKHLLMSGLVLAASAIGGCATKEAEPVAMPEPLNSQSFKREWGADLELKDDEVDRLYAMEDMVFVYTKKHMVYVLNKGSGRIRFSDKIDNSPIKPHQPVVLKDRIVFPTNSTLEIYRRDGKAKERSFATHSSLRTEAVGSPTGSRVFFGVDTPGAGRMVAAETLPGDYKPVREVWELMSTHGAPINSAPAVWGGVCYVGYEDGEVYAINADTREGIWATSTGTTFKTYGPVQADLRADENGVYVPSTDSKFYCLDKAQGRVKWSYFAGSSLRDTAEVSLTTVYLPVTALGMVAIDKLQGPAVREPKWVVRDMVKFLAEDEKFAYFQRSDNVIAAVDKVTGEPKFTNKRRDFVAFATNARDKEGTIFASTKDGRVYAIRPVLKLGDVGEVVWQPIVPDAPVLASK